MQIELETSFIYEDTPDQAKSTADVKADMEAQNPMDRLVCGDVGFGKTEIAIRAAMKAAVDGKQVAVLVPTTVLAMQHFKTFKKRLGELPVTVDYVNRFRTAKEVTEIIKRLEAGQIDILIGTHTLAPHKINYRANIWALQSLSVSDIIAVNAVGGITQEMQSGVISVPHQIIDYTYGREHTFFDGTSAQFPLKHIDFSYPYSQSLRQIILETHSQLIDYSVYGATQGPRLESMAEIIKLEKEGCDIVGMTGMPEAALAREVEINYACVALVVNPAAGKSPDIITMEQIYQVLEQGMEQVGEIIVKAANTFYANS